MAFTKLWFSVITHFQQWYEWTLECALQFIGTLLPKRDAEIHFCISLCAPRRSIPWGKKWDVSGKMSFVLLTEIIGSYVMGKKCLPTILITTKPGNKFWVTFNISTIYSGYLEDWECSNLFFWKSMYLCLGIQPKLHLSSPQGTTGYIVYNHFGKFSY